MKPAIQYLKESFPDWKDWSEGSLDTHVKVMQEYSIEVARKAISKLEIITVNCMGGERSVIVNPEKEIETP